MSTPGRFAPGGSRLGDEAKCGRSDIARRARSSTIWRRSTCPGRRRRVAICSSRCARFRSTPSTTRSRAAAARRRGLPEADAIKVVGYDAAGVVVETAREARLFKPGDEVFYAGSVGRPGANMEFHLVDERIVGRKPRTLDFAAAAALPLTSITAWEAMFDRLDVAKPVPGAARAILILGGAGGVGSIAIQLARQLTDLTVVATASRPETVQWSKDMGAHHVVDHKKPLAPQVAALGLGAAPLSSSRRRLLAASSPISPN